MQNPGFQRTLVLGLGGAGRLTVTHLKRMFLDTFGGLPPCVKLLCLDTDAGQVALRSAESQRECRLDPDQFIHLSVQDPMTFIEHSQTVQKWYAKPIQAGAIMDGAGAVRQNGRLALFHHLQLVQQRLDKIWSALWDQRLPSLMETARTELGSATDFQLLAGPPRVYVCGSLCGGTGSGTFLDVGILLRDREPDAIIQGFFLLNWLYRNMAFAHRVGGNAYAALTEIDYLQDVTFGAPGFVPYQVKYGDKTVEVRKPPYNLIHLVDGMKENRETVDNVAAVCETVATSIFLSAGSMGLKVRSVVDNLLMFINTAARKVFDGKGARYSSLGLSSLYYPAHELHRLIAARTAHELCEQALAEVAHGPAEAERRAGYATVIEPDVDTLFTRLNLTRDNVRNEMCPAFELPQPGVTSYAVAHPEGLPALLEGAEQQLVSLLANAFAAAGEAFVDAARQAFTQKAAELAADRKLEDAYRRQWLDTAARRFEAWSDEASAGIKEATARVVELRKSAGQQCDQACATKSGPLFGGGRKKAVRAWQATAQGLLEALRDKLTLEYERSFHDNLRQALGALGPEMVTPDSAVIRALSESEIRLRRAAAVEQQNVALLRGRSGQVLIGNGNIVVVPGALKSTLLQDSIKVDFGEFKAEGRIHNPEDYLRPDAQAPERLDALFTDYCRSKLDRLASVGIDEAMETIGEKSGDREGYFHRQFEHLFRLGSPLWSFDHAKLNVERQPMYERIISVGVFDEEEGYRALDKYVTAARRAENIEQEHAYSTTRDRQRIWLLNFAGALPAFMVGDLREQKEGYEEKISPTYHSDLWLEMNVPDLFPVGTNDNIALRVLGMAIVPGIDVIRDEKLPPHHGHRFNCVAPGVCALYDCQSKEWTLFRDLYDEVRNSDASRKDDLLCQLAELLQERVKGISPEKLRAAITSYIEKVDVKLAGRDFSRVISERLTYREIRELRLFLAPKREGGYGLDIEKYVKGETGP